MSRVHVTLNLNSHEPNERALLEVLHGLGNEMAEGRISRGDMEVSLKNLMMAGLFVDGVSKDATSRLAHNLSVEDKSDFLVGLLDLKPQVREVVVEREVVGNNHSVRQMNIASAAASKGYTRVDSQDVEMEDPSDLDVKVNANPDMVLGDVDKYDAIGKSGMF